MTSRRQKNVEYAADSGRPTSEMLVDVHIYVMPPDLWREHLHSAVSQIIHDTISAGFIRVPPDLPLYAIRNEIATQIGFDLIPRQFVFIKSVGRCFTQVRPKQERELRAKHFTPPMVEAPELFVLDSDAAAFSRNSSNGNNDDELEKLRLRELLKKTGRSSPAAPALTTGPPRQSTSSTHPLSSATDTSTKSSRGIPTQSRHLGGPRQPPLVHHGSPPSRRDPTVSLPRRDAARRTSPPLTPPVLDSSSRRQRYPNDRHNAPSSSPAPDHRRRRSVSSPPPSSSVSSRMQTRSSPAPSSAATSNDGGSARDGSTSSGDRSILLQSPAASPRTPPSAQQQLQPSSIDLAAERKRLRKDLVVLHDRRKELEQAREELIKKNKQLLAKTGNQKKEVRNAWKKRFYDEKKKTPSKEGICAKLRQELDQQHRRIAAQLDVARETGKRSVQDGDRVLQLAEIKIKATKLEHEIEAMHSRLENAKLRLTTEIKLRNQAQGELQALRTELLHRKVNAHKSRSSAYRAVVNSNTQEIATARTASTVAQPERRQPTK